MTYIAEKYWYIKSIKSISALKVLKKSTEYNALIHIKGLYLETFYK